MVNRGKGVPALLITAGLQHGVDTLLVHRHADCNALKSGHNLTRDNAAFTRLNRGNSGLALVGENREGLRARIEEQGRGRSEIGESELAFRKRLGETYEPFLQESTRSGYREEPRWSRQGPGCSGER